MKEKQSWIPAFVVKFRVSKKTMYISLVGRGVLNPLFYKDPSTLPTPFFKFCPVPPSLLPPTPTPTAVSLAEWVITPHLMCYFT